MRRIAQFPVHAILGLNGDGLYALYVLYVLYVCVCARELSQN